MAANEYYNSTRYYYVTRDSKQLPSWASTAVLAVACNTADGSSGTHTCPERREVKTILVIRREPQTLRLSFLED